MDEAKITVAASYTAQENQQKTAAGLASQQDQEKQEDIDAQIASKCKELGQQTNLQLMQNVFRLQEW